MMIRLLAAAAGLALLLAAPAWAQDDWKDIELSDSRINVVGDTGSIEIEKISRRRGYIRDGSSYDEFWLITDGFLRYQSISFDGGRFEGGGFVHFNADQVAELFSDMWPIGDTDQRVTAAEVKSFGSFHYAYVDIEWGRCLLFQEVFGGAGGANFGGNQLVYGTLCRDSSNVALLPNTAKRFLGALEKDGSRIIPVDKLQ